MSRSADSVYVGIDVGTSSCRVCAIDAQGRTLAFASSPLPAPTPIDGRLEQQAPVWWNSLVVALEDALRIIDRARVRSLAVDGTSGTLLLATANGEPLTPALMYNDQTSVAQAARIERAAPADSTARGASSALAKLLQLSERHPEAGAAIALHQADWLAGCLRGAHGTTDENNALKLGYDPVAREWPAWMAALGIAPERLPRVVPAGTGTGRIDAAMARRFDLPNDCEIVAGTTDSVAAAVASGVEAPGDAVTSLGTTLVLKVVSAKPVACAAHGIYTHRVRDVWLAGGASNSGGGVLASLFTPPQLAALSARIDTETPSPFDYYPLARAGERFPVDDPTLAPRMTPRPADDVAFLHGLLESMARIEAEGYRLLARLGAPFPRTVRTAGGGAHNAAWRRIRERVLGVPVTVARETEAAYGAALLAREGALT
jgi:sugar (pentulose or hexulose) kinase